MNNIDDKHFTLPQTELIAALKEAREKTLELVGDLKYSQFEAPLHAVVNPFLWELGHVAYFYEGFLLQVLDGIDPIIEGGNDLYNSFEVDHDDRWKLPLPSKEKTLEYMNQIHELCIRRLDNHEPDAKETYLYLLSILHEDMHGEAFTYMRQTLEYSKPVLKGAFTKSDIKGSEPLPGDVVIPGGNFQLGAAPEHPFVFDNEKWAHTVDVAPFRISRAAVTNAEFVKFVEDRGYLRRELWSTQGWIWRKKKGAQHPLYWNRNKEGWLRKDFDRWIPMEEHAPVVHVTWYEAEAYCKWAERRLPTEAEWEMAASAEPNKNGDGITDRKRLYPWGDEAPTPDRANLDSSFLGCVDVGAFPSGESAFGCRQMVGNVWEWTETPFYPFPGFLVDYPYKEYSAPWFGYRKVLKGGSWATRSRLACNKYRNFFTADRNDIFAGFRTCAL